jgi:hypothetical protein
MVKTAAASMKRRVKKTVKKMSKRGESVTMKMSDFLGGTEKKKKIHLPKKITSANVPYNAPNPQTTKPGPKGTMDVNKNTRHNVFSVVQPKKAAELGIAGRVNDTTFRPTLSIAVQQTFTLGTVQNTGSGTYDMYAEFFISGSGTYQSATGFAGGIPNAMTVATADPTYASWSGFADRVRMVSRQVDVMQSAGTTNLGGQGTIGRCSVSQRPQVASGNYTWAQYDASKDTSSQTFGKPGVKLSGIWLPVQGDGSNDWQFVVTSYATAG